MMVWTDARDEGECLGGHEWRGGRRGSGRRHHVRGRGTHTQAGAEGGMCVANARAGGGGAGGGAARREHSPRGGGRHSLVVLVSL